MVLSDHKQLRASIEQLTTCLDVEAIEAHGDQLPKAREIFAELSSFLRVHMRFEDTFLAPLLRDDFAWGDFRARKLLEHHAEQREELEDLRALVASPSTDPVELRKSLDHFVALLDLDMQHEERGILTADVLGDEIVVVNAGG